MAEDESLVTEPNAEELRVLDWRYTQLRALGIDQLESRLLAESEADLELVRRLVATGCPTDLAVQIAL
jgi:hypothetical protein